jgi:hypothetical protein
LQSVAFCCAAAGVPQTLVIKIFEHRRWKERMTDFRSWRCQKKSLCALDHRLVTLISAASQRETAQGAIKKPAISRH